MKKFKPYANESDVRQIGGLQVENRLDRITLAGDLDLTLDLRGLAHARELKRLLDDVVAHLESRDLPGELPAPPVRTTKNPFA